VSLFSVLLTAYFIFLRRHSGQDHLAVGAPMPAREGPWRSTIGHCTNTVVLSAAFEPDTTIAGLVCEVHATVVRAMRHRHYPLVELVERLNPPRDARHHPYFQTRFNYQNERGAESIMTLMAGAQRGAEGEAARTVSWGGWTVAPYALEMSRGDPGNALDIELAELDDRLGYSLKYDAQRLKRSTVERYIAHLDAVLQAMVVDDGQAVDRIGLLPDRERRQLLHDWNDTASNAPAWQSVREAFEAQVQRAPQALALVYAGHELSYAELNRRANRLAHELIGHGVHADVRVAVCLPRGYDMVVALLAVMKAGGAYVPMDPSHPWERLTWVLQDSAPKVLITRGDAVSFQSCSSCRRSRSGNSPMRSTA
jgi:non-ribosomal peptide synthetase component F